MALETVHTRVPVGNSNSNVPMVKPTQDWPGEHAWADGIYLQEHSDCMLVLLGAPPEGKKELIGFQVGVTAPRPAIGRGGVQGHRGREASCTVAI
jgi:hypothetical protein